MTEQLQIVARYRGTETNPKFTKTTTIPELMSEIAKALPVDLIYFVLPHLDGQGYSLRQAGILVPHLVAPGEAEPEPEVRTPITAEFSTTPLPPPSPVRDRSTLPPSLPADEEPIPTPDDDIVLMEPDMTFPKPKSQTELLHAMGLELPPTPAPKRAARKGKKVKGQPDIDPALGRQEEISASDPRLKARPGSTKITHIKAATPAEAKAASHFGKS